jgi:PhnB protein
MAEPTDNSDSPVLEMVPYRNVDEIAAQAVAAGGTMVMEPTDQDHGERQCRLRDPFGHEWLLGHEIAIKPARARAPS